MTGNEDEKNTKQRFTDGQILRFVQVRFPGNSKSFPFQIGKRNFPYGQRVLAMSDRGMTVGYINSFPYEKGFEQNMLPIRTISKLAEEKDLEENKEQYFKERESWDLFNESIKKYKLDMELTHVEYIQFGKKAVFYFISPARVDFRELVKDLVNKLKVRIELRQISVRDRSAALGGLGPCGLQLCCSSFLSKFGNVSIKMAKNQNLALIPTRLNGVCGQLKCCLKYEDNVYATKRKELPNVGSFIQAQNGDKGKVLRLHLLKEQFEMITEEGKIRRYTQNQYSPDNELPRDWEFPSSLQHTVNETSTVIGLEEEVIPHTDVYPEEIIDDEGPEEVLVEEEAPAPEQIKPENPPRKRRRRRR